MKKGLLGKWLIAGAALATIVTFILVFVTPLKPIERTLEASRWVGRAIVAVLTFGVPVWVLLLAVFLLSVLIWVLARVLARAGDDEEPRFEQYTKDRIFGVDWMWQQAQWGPSSVTALCPTCKNELEWSGHRFDCSYCRKGIRFEADVSFAASPSDVATKEIRRRVRSGEWKQRLSGEQGS